MAHTSSIGNYDEKVESWENYEIRLQAWMLVNGFSSDDKKRSALIAEIGAATFAILKDLAFPSQVLDKSFDDLLSLLRQHYRLSSTPMVNRLKLHERKQGATETLTEYIAALKKIASYCDYGSALEAQLRDIFLFGVRNKKIVKRLLEESQKGDFTWQKATSIALSMEAVDKDVEGFHPPTDTSGSVNRISHRGGGRSQQSRGNQRVVNKFRYDRTADRRSVDYGSASNSKSGFDISKVTCYECGQKGHMRKTCPNRRRDRFRNGQQNRSHDSSHASRNNNHHGSLNRSQRGSSHNSHRVHHVDSQFDQNDTVTTENVDDLSESFHRLYSLSVSETEEVPAEYQETLKVEGAPIRFIIDTACPVTLISSQLYQRHFKHLPLRSNDLKLCSYSHHRIPVQGVLQVRVLYEDVQFNLPLYVTEGDNASLLGRQWLQAIRLDWCRVFQIQATDTEMETILSEFQDVFAERQTPMMNFKADIQVKDGVTPLFHKPRPVPFSLKERVGQELDRLQEAGIITRIDSSDWAAPLVVVPKADNSLRLCGDYKVTINQVIKQETYPLPNAEDLFASLAGDVFTKLDLDAAYQQLQLTENSKQYLVVNTHQGLYQYERLSFGVSTAPSIFQRVMDQILQGIDGVTCYLDDILIASSKEEHADKVRQVLERLRKYGVRLKKKKCSFMMSRVIYLGHEISAQGIQPTEEKIKAIQLMRDPTNLHELRVLLGMVNYYAKFMPDQATLLAPWYELLQKGKTFLWNSECKSAFRKVKNILASNKLLVHYDTSKPIVLACDASPVGLGCVLSHVVDGVEKPIAYASRSLTKAEQNYCQLEREGLAIIYGLTKFHKYVYGRHITIITDNKPITRILGSKVGIPSLAALRLQRWALILMAHNYDLKFRSSKEDLNCDGLSRLPGSADNFLAQELSVNYFSHLNDLPVEAKQIAEATRKHPVMSKVLDYVKHGWPNHCEDNNVRPYFNRRNELSSDGDCLLWGLRVVIPPCYRERLLTELHMSHPGIVKMKAMSRSYLWFPGIDAAIEELVGSCGVCQAMQKDAPTVPLIPWEYPCSCWERIHIDFAELNKQNYLIVIDAYSKWLEVIEISTTTSQQTIIELRKLFARFGLPKVVVSDNGPQLVSTEMEMFLKSNGIRHSLSPSYHPATNGAAERCVQTVKGPLKKCLLESRDTKQGLQNFLLQYRTTPHATTNRTPAELFMKRPLRTRFNLLKPDVRQHVYVKQEKQKSDHDVHSGKTHSFVVGEIVRVKNTYDGIERYVKGIITKVCGPYRYVVKIGRRCRYAHVEHLRKTGELNIQQNDQTEIQHTLPDRILPDHPTVHERNCLPPTLVDVPHKSMQPTAMSPNHDQQPSLVSVPDCHAGSEFPSTSTKPTASSSPCADSIRRSLRSRKAPERLIETCNGVLRPL